LFAKRVTYDLAGGRGRTNQKKITKQPQRAPHKRNHNVKRNVEWGGGCPTKRAKAHPGRQRTIKKKKEESMWVNLIGW